MATDFSRVRLNPLLDYAGVVLKQGGVLLDADANELADVLDRRLRALASDTLGRSTVSSTTPDAFKITLPAGGTLQIGKGRLYVDGLLAENHGAASALAAKRMFDPLLSELQFTDTIAYTAQPYLNPAPALPTAGHHLVYLDVWDREVTFLEDPDLVESAVGVETASRIQTVWQVRALADDAGNTATCSTPDANLAGWEGLIAPSTGVLTTGTFDVAPVDDPCELPPTGGYRGHENQLYRVEIHNPGQPGAGATFKWSRENASVGSRVISTGATELELESLGRDDVLSIKNGDWIEITDDAHEFAQLAGEMRKITSVTAATRKVTFAAALPAPMQAANPDARNMRVRRWDQAGLVFRTNPAGNPVQIQDLNAGVTGTIAIPAAATTILLENGVTVSFASTGAKGFRTGDYWVFAARTADASVEPLDRAPPRGIHHHYARLGIWDVAAGTVTDCRTKWPPSGGDHEDVCCTASVTEQSHVSGAFTIQDGVNKVAQTGGTVCLAPGTYPLREPVQMTNLRSVVVRGHGAATVVTVGASDAASGGFVMKGCRASGIEHLAIVSAANGPAIAVDGAIGLRLRELVLAVVGIRDRRPASAIALSGIVLGASITDNAIFGDVGILANDPAAGRDDDRSSFLLAGALRIEDNVIWSRRAGIALGRRSWHVLDTSITGNDILASADGAIIAMGRSLKGASVNIDHNHIAVPGMGITLTLDGALIADNHIVSTAGADDRARGRIGICLGVPAIGEKLQLAVGPDRNGTARCQILANQIVGFGAAGIRVGMPVRDLIIKLNIIERCGNGILTTDDARSAAISVENNHLRDIGSTTEDTDAFVLGIAVRRTDSVSAVGNTIRALGTKAIRSQLRVGIMGFGALQARVSGNEIMELAPADSVGRSAAILLLAPVPEFDVSSNIVQRDALKDGKDTQGDWRGIVVLDTDLKNQFSKYPAGASVRTDAMKTLVLDGGRPYVAVMADPLIDDRPQVVAKGLIHGNTVNHRGQSPAVEVFAGECQFNDNRIVARLNHQDAVQMTLGLVVVSGNRIDGGELSLRIEVNPKAAAVLGNVTSAGIVVGGGMLGAPWNTLNLLV